MSNGFVAVDDYLEVDDEVDFEKFMDDIVLAEERAEKRTKVLSECEIPYRRWAERHHEKSSNLFRVKR